MLQRPGCRGNRDTMSRFLPQSWFEVLRPYTADGPVVEKGKELRAVTIFELKDLVQAAGEKNRHVILMARQCGICGRTRALALRPLLTNPNLKVFSTLVMDAATARELLK
jgi:hypothetical protein